VIPPTARFIDHRNRNAQYLRELGAQGPACEVCGSAGGQGTIRVIGLVGQSLAPLLAGKTSMARELTRRKAKTRIADPDETGSLVEFELRNSDSHGDPPQRKKSVSQTISPANPFYREALVSCTPPSTADDAGDPPRLIGGQKQDGVCDVPARPSVPRSEDRRRFSGSSSLVPAGGTPSGYTPARERHN